jgi:hypothetical protein
MTDLPTLSTGLKIQAFLQRERRRVGYGENSRAVRSIFWLLRVTVRASKSILIPRCSKTVAFLPP